MAIQTSVGVKDNMSAAFAGITKAVNTCLGAFVNLQSATNEGLDPSHFAAIESSIQDMNVAAQRFADGLNDAEQEQNQLNNSMQRGVSNANSLLGKVKSLLGAYATFKTVQGALSLSDQLASTGTRLDLMNDGLQTNAQIQNQIMQAANNARGSYLAMAAAVSKFGNNAGEAFSSTNEIIQFAELVQKQFTIAGTGATEASAAMLQLTQALGSGVLRGDELNSIFEQAPNLIQNIAKYMGVSVGQIRDLASDGQITADIVKNAMFAAADDINAKFEEMPMTWAQITTKIKNDAIAKFQPVLQKINDIANSAKFQNALNGITNALAVAANVATVLIDGLVTGASFVYDNWSVIAPLFWGIVAVMTAYTVVQGVTNALTTAHAIAEGVRGAAMALSAGATFTATAAQYGLNAALLACPLTWIVLGIAAVIVAIYAGVAAFNEFTDSSISATGIVMGAFAVLGAYIFNRVIVPVQHGFAAFANFIGNVFNNPVAAIKILFYDMAITVMGYIRTLAKGIQSLLNAIPGVKVNITSGLDNIYNNLQAGRQKVKDESGYKEYVKAWDYMEFDKAAQAGYNFGKGIDNKVSGLFNVKTGSIFDTPTPQSSTAGAYEYTPFDEIADNTASTAGNTKNIANSLEITEENLKWMKDIAEREVIDRTVFKDIQVNLGGVQNTVNNMTDLDGVADYLGNVISEQMASSAEGVYA